uniref:Uncharacterized protein n=1 Tax=Chenopodium quinoa TaxID=63459 RepID=A0A803MSQ0_CHEQI
MNTRNRLCHHCSYQKIGRSRAKQILSDLSLQNKLTKELSDDELIQVRDEVSKYMIEGDLVWRFMAEGEEDLPRDAKIVKSLLKSMGVEEHEPRVVHQFLELWYRYAVDV